MGSPVAKFPSYAKLAFILLISCVILAIVYLGQHVLIPLSLALLFAILLRPVAIFFNKKLKFPYAVAVLVSVIFFVIFITAIIVLVSWQVADMTDDWNKIKENLSMHFHNAQLWIKNRLHVSYTKQQNYIEHLREETLKSDTELMGNTITSFTDTLLMIVLIPIYTFLILLYQNLFIKFLYEVVSEQHTNSLQKILAEIRTVVQSYIVGLMIEMGLVAFLTISGLMLLGVQYAFLLGLITAILNVVPYLGIMTAAVITIFATLGSSSEVSLIVGIIGVNIVVQLIDNNLIVPKIVGNKVRINALATMVGVITGGTISGISGMVLSIPIIAILKVIFDHIEPLKPWGSLMGNTVPEKFMPPSANI
jgi:predicted PurR-regulated permease PerM